MMGVTFPWSTVPETVFGGWHGADTSMKGGPCWLNLWRCLPKLGNRGWGQEFRSLRPRSTSPADLMSGNRPE